MMVYPAFLDDAYEGELMVLFMDLLADACRLWGFGVSGFRGLGV